MSRALAILLVAASVGCAPAAEPDDLCARMAARCGGAFPGNWVSWCRSECVPEAARTIPCDLNEQCVLCDAARDDDNILYFGLPVDELEYMWTLTDTPREPIHPPTEPAPTGGAFLDSERSWNGEGHVGSWQAYDPFPRLHPFAPEGFCEPGPNRYTSDNVVGTTGAMVLRAERFADDATVLDGLTPPYCPDGRCLSGPYASCDMPPTGCQYREVPDSAGLGSSAQADRVDSTGAQPTYGYGHYRATFKAAGDTVGPQPGFVYAFFTQGNDACEGAAPNFETNTSELDIEVSSTEGEAGGMPFCTRDQTCLQVSTWVSSTQGIANYAGVLRHQVSGFRFRDRSTAAEYRTFGFDWQPEDVRFTYDRDPHDCDEQSGTCAVPESSLAICQHLRFVPRRPAPMHFQLWNAWWAGNVPRGTHAEMSVERVWHEPTSTPAAP